MGGKEETKRETKRWYIAATGDKDQILGSQRITHLIAARLSVDHECIRFLALATSKEITSTTYIPVKADQLCNTSTSSQDI